MPTCRYWFVNKVNYFFNINQLMAMAKTAVVVKKRPNAAVAVNNERFILRTISKILIIFSD